MPKHITITTPWGQKHEATVPDDATPEQINNFVESNLEALSKKDGASGAFMVDQNGQNRRWIDQPHMREAGLNGWNTVGPTQEEKNQNAPKTGTLGTIGGSLKKVGQMAAGFGQMIGNFTNPGATAMDTAEMGRRAVEAGQQTPQDASDTERGAMIAGTLAGADTPKLAENIRKRDLGGAIVESTPLAVAAAAPEIARRAPGVIEGTADFMRAPSDPNVLYNSYLRPSAKAPISVPSAPEPVIRAVLRDMEAAGDGEAANRIASGQATVGDLDIARQSANRLSRSIYRSPGNYPPGMATGADDFARAIRDRSYPLIERSQGLPEGSLRGVKTLQGQLMESERNPTLANGIIKKGVGVGAGTILGYKMGGWPGGVVGGIMGERLAEPIAAAADRGIIGLRTKTLAAQLPEPGIVARPGLPPPRIMSASEPEPSIANAPVYSPTTRAQRLGLMLPEKTGGPIELPYMPEMTPDEVSASTLHQIRNGKAPLGLPARSKAIPLTAGEEFGQ